MGRPLNVLLVEDNEDDAALVLRELVKGGFDPSHLRVENEPMMRTALTLRAWDVVISDHSMPHFSAPRALEVLRSSGLDLPFIIVSGTMGEDAAVEAMHAGAHDFLVKGRLKRLVPAVERELREAVLRRERRLAEKTLRQSEARFRQLSESLPVFVLVEKEGVLLYANAAAVKGLGYTDAKELLSRALKDVLGLDGSVPEVPLGKQVEQSWLRKDGRRIQVEVVAQSILFDNAWAVSFAARDVSEQRQAQAQLFLSDRLVSMGTLAAGVAHEINNPLAVVLSSVDFTLRELRHTIETVVEQPVPADSVPALLSELEEPLVDAREAAGRVREIVGDLKMLSRSDDEKREPVDVVRVLETSVRMARNELRHRAQVIRELSPVPHVVANEGRLGQVFLNLLVNAAQAIPEGRAGNNEVRIVTRLDPQGRVVVEVKDTGTGIPPEVIPRIFEPFFTTKPVGVGTGLGLPICHRLVTQMGGRLEVESEPGRGSTFRVSLMPATETETACADDGAGLQVSGPARARILVVDDDAAVRKVVQRTLEREHDITAVASATEALERIRAGERFRLVLCDLMMPELTGMELYEMLQGEAPEVAERFVFLTGGAFTPKARSFLESHAQRMLEKPFGVDQLSDTVRAWVG